MNEGFPEALQIEVTSNCNFNCQMCVRRTWKTRPLDMNIALYKKIAKSCFPKLKRLILYGFGEPLTHPNFLEMLKIARLNLHEESKIIISTNGSLMTPRVTDKIMEKIGLGAIFFSIDTTDRIKHSRIREGSELKLIVENIRYLAKKDEAKTNLELGIETVLTIDNFRDLPELVKFSAENEIDYIVASHVVPYTKDILAKTLYLTLSKPAVEILKPSIGNGWDLLHKSAIELLSRAYGVKTEHKLNKPIESFWVKAERKGYWINLPLLLNSIDKLEILSHLEKVFHQTVKTAREHQVNLRLPSLYVDARKRMCPYIESKTLAIRSDGKVSPCLEFMYSHPVYINKHEKHVHEVIFGDAEKENIGKVWRKAAYTNFRCVRQNMADDMPWCGDCPYSSLGCFYTRANDVDCYANEPTCNECLYSVSLAQCII